MKKSDFYYFPEEKSRGLKINIWAYFPGLYGAIMRTGKMKDITQFDAEFFNYPPVFAERADPQQRMLLEVAYETIVDAGQYKKNKEDMFLVSLLYQK